MANYSGAVQGGAGTSIAYPTLVAAQHARVKRTFAPEYNVEALLPSGQGFAYNLVYVNAAPPPVAHANYYGAVEDKTTFAFDWFEKFHVEPSLFDLGNVLTTQQIAVTVYSAYRKEYHTWLAFVNNAGAGVELLNAPSLPAIFAPQTGTGGMLLEVSPNGPPTVDTTLDFVFDEMTLSPAITLERIILFDTQPELPYLELLEFLVQIMTHKDGSEMRVALRKNPRQFFEWDFILDAGRERSRIHNLLFDWQSRVFGIPQWHEATFTSVAVAINDLVINVRSTAFADYREGGLVLIYKDSSTYDVLQTAPAGVGATTLTLVNPVLHAYTTNVLVMPLRSGITRPSISGDRFPSDVARLQVRFQVVDNDANLASVVGWNTYNSKILVDDVNSLGGGRSMQEEFVQDIVTLDNATGIPSFSSPWDKGKRRSVKVFWTRTQAALWKVRQLLHSLRGPQTSFYIPTFGKDLTPTANLTTGTNVLTISNVGYTKYIRQRVPMNIIRVVFVNTATTPLLRRITASTEIDANTEQLTIDTNWPSTFTPAAVLRIEYVQLSRIDSNVVRIQHAMGELTTRIAVPLTTVFDE